MDGSTWRNKWSRAAIVGVVILCALPDFILYAGHVFRSDYPGSSYQPRVDAVLKTSDSALRGGPFATVPKDRDYSVAPGLLNDLGIAALVTLLARANRKRATTRTLGLINLFVMVAAVVLLIAALPRGQLPALAPVFLLVPMTVPLYRSPDSIAIHGALAALAIAVAIMGLRSERIWQGLAVGAALFALHKLRSAYGLYSFAAMIGGCLAISARFRHSTSLKRVGIVLLGLAACEIPWQAAMSIRAADNRIVEKDTLSTHNLYEPLVAGLGWTTNPWGIKPQDPWVAAFLAERVGAEPVSLASAESERRARSVYFGFLRERPLALMALYLERIPDALTNYSLLGLWGAALTLLTLVGAFVVSWRKGDSNSLAVCAGGGGVFACLLLQIVVIDTRFIYAYPLRFVSALTLATGMSILLASVIARQPSAMRAGNRLVLTTSPRATQT